MSSTGRGNRPALSRARKELRAPGALGEAEIAWKEQHTGSSSYQGKDYILRAMQRH